MHLRKRFFFFSKYISMLIFLRVCVCVHLRKRRGGVEVVVHGEEREKLVRTEINKILDTHATVFV